MNHHQGRQAATVTALLLTALSAAPAAAVSLHDPSLPAQSAPASGPTHTCWLQRVGTQLVRCDNLTGNGAQAPQWVPEQ